MDYILETEIAAPRDLVIARFLDVEALRTWQDSLVRFEPLTEGDPRAEGAQSRQLHRMGNREVEMVETITARQEPRFFAATYEADGVWNLIENWFEDAGDGRTQWKLRSDFRCQGMMMKLMCLLFPGMFRKQTREFMEKFKAHVEQHARG